MATARREEPDVETEEFNPFLSPPPPPLSSTASAAPALPPRDVNNSRNSAGAGSSSSNPEAANDTLARPGSSRGRRPSRTSNTDVRPNLVAAQTGQQQQVSTTICLATWHALPHGYVGNPVTRAGRHDSFTSVVVSIPELLVEKRERGVVARISGRPPDSWCRPAFTTAVLSCC